MEMLVTTIGYAGFISLATQSLDENLQANAGSASASTN
jgi:hypothetical protein